jgi:hypothetical protein
MVDQRAECSVNPTTVVAVATVGKVTFGLDVVRVASFVVVVTRF